MSWHVAYEYTDKVPGYKGVRYWTTYKSKDDVDRTDDGRLIIVGEGEDAKEVQRIALSYDPSLLFQVAMHKTQEDINGALAALEETEDVDAALDRLDKIADLAEYRFLEAALAASDITGEQSNGES